MQVSHGWHPATMGSLVLDHEHERLLRIAITCQPVNSGIRYDIRTIALHLHTAFGRDEERIVVVALPRKDFPVVETLRFALQMGLPVERGLVALLL